VLGRIVRSGKRIALGTATDPYQPGEARERVTRRFLEMVAQHRNVRLGITTKGSLVLRDLDLLVRIHRRSTLSVHVSLISPHADLVRRLEPLAPPPAVRLEVMRRLAAAGIEVWLALAPVLPAITDGEEDLDRLLGEVSAAGVERLFHNVLFLRSPTKEKYLRWLEAAFPQYLEAYRRAYGRRVYLEGRYRDQVRERIERLRKRHGIEAAHGENPEPEPPVQLRLLS
jgi:DNA repair photolyase